MADNEQMAALRQALDDAVLTHTGRSIGDLASERVLADIMPQIEALYSELRAENAAMRPIVQAMATGGIRYDDIETRYCVFCYGSSPDHTPDCPVMLARVVLPRSE